MPNHPILDRYRDSVVGWDGRPMSYCKRGDYRMGVFSGYRGDEQNSRTEIRIHDYVTLF